MYRKKRLINAIRRLQPQHPVKPLLKYCVGYARRIEEKAM